MESTVKKDTTVRVEPETDDFDFGRDLEEDEDDPEAISLEKIKSNYSGIFDADQRSPKGLSNLGNVCFSRKNDWITLVNISYIYPPFLFCSSPVPTVD